MIDHLLSPQARREQQSSLDTKEIVSEWSFLRAPVDIPLDIQVGDEIEFPAGIVRKIKRIFCKHFWQVEFEDGSIELNIDIIHRGIRVTEREGDLMGVFVR